MSNANKSVTVQVTLELVETTGDHGCSGCVFDGGGYRCNEPEALECFNGGARSVWKIKQEKDNAN